MPKGGARNIAVSILLKSALSVQAVTMIGSTILHLISTTTGDVNMKKIPLQTNLRMTHQQMMTIESYLLSLFESGQDSIHNLLCPFCQGGSSRETGFSVGFLTYPHCLWYKCWRNKCSLGGTYTDTRHKPVLTMNKFPPKPQAKKKVIDRSEWCQLDNEEFLKKYGLTKQECRQWGIYSILRETYSLAYTIWGPDEKERGCVLRCINGKAKPKSLTFNDEGSNGMSWYRTRPDSNTAVLVEDIISAIKVSRHANAIALNGVHINPDRIMEIRKHFSNICLSLDPDARKTMIKRLNDFGAMFDGVGVIFTDRDPKDLGDKELERFFGRIN